MIIRLRQLQISDTREVDKKWIKQYKAVFCILNEKGQVLQWQFTSSEGFDEVCPMFENLKKRFENMGTKLSGIFVHNCCKWRDSLSQIFSDIPVKLDLFHVVQRVVRSKQRVVRSLNAVSFVKTLATSLDWFFARSMMMELKGLNQLQYLMLF